jgi:hypothetical protein
LTFSDWDGKRFVPARILTEIDFDPDKKTISSFYKGRGGAGPSAASAAGGFSRA